MPTVIALAVYFCVSDFVLISQCIYYKNATKSRVCGSERNLDPYSSDEDDAHEALLGSPQSHPATYSTQAQLPNHATQNTVKSMMWPSLCYCPANGWARRASILFGVTLLGLIGWLLAYQSGIWQPISQTRHKAEESFLAIVLGYISALCYLGHVKQNFRAERAYKYV